MNRTIGWASRCKEAHTTCRSGPLRHRARGAHADLRVSVCRGLVALDFDGYAIGGVSVGEGRERGAAGAAGDDASSPARPAAVPDGRRPSAGHSRRRRNRDRPVRLRDADPKWAKRNLFHEQRICQDYATPSHRADPAPIEEGCDVPGVPQSSAVRTFGTCSWPRRCSARSWRRFTT